MTLHPQAQALVDGAADLEPLESLTPEQARERTRQLSLGLPRPGGLASVVDRAADGRGRAIPLRIYTPPGEGARPGLVWFHGGGWVTGDLDTHDGLCRELVLASGATLVAVDYRLAPEHRFPAAVEDAVDAVRWVSARAAELGVDADRLAVGGDSAGGNLAAVTSAIARAGGGPRLRWQLLVYPITDCDFDTASYCENATDHLLSRAAMEWFWDHYLPDPAARRHPDASPLRSRDFGGLPPTFVITAEYDVLRDEGESYARRLQDAGVPVRLDRYDGMLHGFLRRTDQLDCAREALTRIAAEMRRTLFGLPRR